MQLGFEPIMCEADKETFGLDLEHLKTLLIRHRPSIVIMVQVLGIPHKMRELLELQNKFDFTLLEDACASMGSSYKGRKVGTFGEMSSFSLYFGHHISTFEGGLVSTDNYKLYELLVMLRSHGWRKELDKKKYTDLIKKLGTPAVAEYLRQSFKFHVPGFNLRPLDLGAFIGIRQIDKMEWLIQKRSENHQRYQKNLGSYFYTQEHEPDSGNVACTIHFGLLADSGEERDAIIFSLIEHGIETRYFAAGNLGLHEFWTEKYGETSFPMADQIHNRGLFLPNSTALSPEDVDYISSVVIDTVKNFRKGA